MTVDAVGGVWRYAIDLCRGLSLNSVDVHLVGFGPPPSSRQDAEALSIPGLELSWTELPLDWMSDGRSSLRLVAETLNRIAEEDRVDLLHLNLPSQAVGIELGLPVVVVSHSCFGTWWGAVRPGEPFPEHWQWHREITREGFNRADFVLSPSRSHADALERCYGSIEHLSVVQNGSAVWFPESVKKGKFVFAAGRWWDPAKNISTLDKAASQSRWTVMAAGDLVGPSGDAADIVRYARPLGALARSAMLDMILEAPIFVSTSLYEPFGLAVLEAARGAAALVLSDIPVYRELWDDAALFVAPGDGTALGAALNRLIDDQDERLRLGREARRRSARYHLHAQVEAMRNIYAKACEQVGSATVPAE